MSFRYDTKQWENQRVRKRKGFREFRKRIYFPDSNQPNEIVGLELQEFQSTAPRRVEASLALSSTPNSKSDRGKMSALKKELKLRLFQWLYSHREEIPIFRIVAIKTYHLRNKEQRNILLESLIGRGEDEMYLQEKCFVVQIRNPMWRFIDSWLSIAPFPSLKKTLEFVSKVHKDPKARIYIEGMDGVLKTALVQPEINGLVAVNYRLESSDKELSEVYIIDSSLSGD